jgi:hypothetical protein
MVSNLALPFLIYFYKKRQNTQGQEVSAREKNNAGQEIIK